MLHAKEKRDARQFNSNQRVQQVPLVNSALFEARESRLPATRSPIPSLLSLPNRPPRLHQHRQSGHHLRTGGRPQRFLGPGPVMHPPMIVHHVQGIPVARGNRPPPPFLPRCAGHSLLGSPPLRATLRNSTIGFTPGGQTRPRQPYVIKDISVRTSRRKRDSGYVATGKNNSHMTKSKIDAKVTKAENKPEACVESRQSSSPEHIELAVKKLNNVGAGELGAEAESRDAGQTGVDTDSPVMPQPGEEESPRAGVEDMEPGRTAEVEEDMEPGRTAEVQGVGTSLIVTIQRSSESRAFSTVPEDSAVGQNPDRDKAATTGKYCCYICNFPCANQQEFQGHMISLDHQQKMMVIQHQSNTCLAGLLPQMQHSLQGPRREKRHGLQRWCAICQSHFTGDLIEHRRTKKHKVAKVSSRPFCTVCERYFRNPRKFVEHMKSLEHKQQVEELREGGGPEVMEELITVDAIGCFEGEDDYEEEGNDDNEEDTSPEKVISEINDCAGYDPDKQYGASFVVPAAGFLCKLCHKFYHFESSARETHCKSLVHYQNLQKYKAMLEVPQEDMESLKSSKSGTLSPDKSHDPTARTEAKRELEETSQSEEEQDSPSPELLPEETSQSEEEQDSPSPEQPPEETSQSEEEQDSPSPERPPEEKSQSKEEQDSPNPELPPEETFQFEEEQDSPSPELPPEETSQIEEEQDSPSPERPPEETSQIEEEQDSPSPERPPEGPAPQDLAGSAKRLARKASGECESTAQKRKHLMKSLNS